MFIHCNFNYFFIFCVVGWLLCSCIVGLLCPCIVYLIDESLVTLVSMHSTNMIVWLQKKNMFNVHAVFDCEICSTIYGRTIHYIKLHNTWISSLIIHGHKVAQIWTSSCTIHGHQVAQYMDSSYHLWHILANKKNLEISAKVKFKVAIWKLIHDFISAPCSNLVSIWSCLVPISW